MKKNLSTKAKEPIRLRTKKLSNGNLPSIWMFTEMESASMSF